MKRFAITKIDKSGLRTLATANQGRCFRDTRQEAERQLQAMLSNNSIDTLESVFGDLSKMRVDEIECYENGDSTRTVLA